jgi:uncharacterized membrane protein
MSELNPYAPPKAAVVDVIVAEAAPALWNPTAAGVWSLLFSPIFGACLHMQNWKALGQPEKATASKKWIFGSSLFFITVACSSLFMPESKALDNAGTLGGLALLIAWYYAIGKSQQTYVAARFGKQYPRRSWTIPLAIAIGIFIAYVGLFFLLTLLLIFAGVISIPA